MVVVVVVVLTVVPFGLAAVVIVVGRVHIPGFGA